MSSDQRRSFRILERQPCREATLQVAQTEVPVRILNESAGGLAVLAERHLDVKASDVGRLCVDSASFEVRVTHVTAAVRNRADEVDTADSRTEVPLFQLGLERLKELDPWDDELKKSGWRELLLPAFVRPGVPLLSLPVILAALLIIVLPITAAVVLLDTDGSRLRQPNGAKMSPSRAGQSSSASRISQDPRDQLLYATNRDSPDALVLLSEEVVQSLMLSDTQQAEIGKISEARAEADDQIDVLWARTTRKERSQMRTMLHDEARRRCLDVLTDQQRARWDAMQTNSSDMPAESENGS